MTQNLCSRTLRPRSGLKEVVRLTRVCAAQASSRRLGVGSRRSDSAVLLHSSARPESAVERSRLQGLQGLLRNTLAAKFRARTIRRRQPRWAPCQPSSSASSTSVDRSMPRRGRARGSQPDVRAARTGRGGPDGPRPCRRTTLPRTTCVRLLLSLIRSQCAFSGSSWSGSASFSCSARIPSRPATASLQGFVSAMGLGELFALPATRWNRLRLRWCARQKRVPERAHPANSCLPLLKRLNQGRTRPSASICDAARSTLSFEIHPLRWVLRVARSDPRPRSGAPIPTQGALHRHQWQTRSD